MSCLLAILLYTGGMSNVEDRLVVIDLAPKMSFHQTYTSNRDRWFQSVAHLDDITMGPSPTKKPGTHMTIYCSQSRTKYSLLRFVTADSNKLIRSAEPGFSVKTESKAHCKTLIEDNFKKTSRQRLANSATTSQSICTEDIIKRLRSKEKINAVESEAGRFLYDFDNRAASLPEPVAIASVVLNGRFLRLATIDKMSFGLTWYRGFLTLFRMDVPEYWRPIQSLSQEARPDDYVLEFLAATSLSLRLMMVEVARSQTNVASKPEIGQAQENDGNNDKNPSILSLLQVLDQSEFRFTEYIATGFLGKDLRI